MAKNNQGAQRDVYLSHEEWKKHDEIGAKEGLPGKTKFLIYLFRQYLAGNLVFKKRE